MHPGRGSLWLANIDYERSREAEAQCQKCPPDGLDVI